MPPPEKASAMTVEPSSPPSVMNFGVGGGASEPTVFMGPTSLAAQPQASIKAAATSAPAKFNLIIPPPLSILHSRQKYLTLHRCRKQTERAVASLSGRLPLLASCPDLLKRRTVGKNGRRLNSSQFLWPVIEIFRTAAWI